MIYEAFFIPMNIEKIYQIYLSHRKVTIDSRSCADGSVFFALKGDHVNGNQFAKDALDKGCAFAVVNDPAIVKDSRYILVKDPLRTLQELAGEHRRHLHIPVIAITGTNGKTTTKELAIRVLSKKYKVSGTTGNLNNHIGLPLTILGSHHDTDLLVLEMGANHPGEITGLCELADPTHGLITNIGKAHLEGFGTIEQIIDTKAALYRYLRKKKGTIFYNQDNEILKKELSPADVRISYGMDDQADYRFRNPVADPFLSFDWQSLSGDLKVTTRLYGLYNFENVMAAITIGAFFDVNETDILRAVKDYVPENMRSQVITTGKNTVIMDAYNANPTSMRLAIQEFIKQQGGKKVLILGDMLELGDKTEEEHERILQMIREHKFSPGRVFLSGKTFASLSSHFGYKGFEKTKELISYLRSYPIEDHLILIKGSRLMKMEEVVGVL